MVFGFPVPLVALFTSLEPYLNSNDHCVVTFSTNHWLKTGSWGYVGLGIRLNEIEGLGMKFLVLS